MDNTKTIAEIYASLITAIGEDVTREGLKDTPERAAKALQFLTKGYSQNLEDVVSGILFTSDNDSMVVVKDIELFSLCEHHLLPFIGRCHVGYIPNGKVIGLSKIARIVDMYARRLQIQENLTKQIASAIMKVTGAQGVGVVIEASHLCIMARGVEKQHAQIQTNAILGSFRKNKATRQEFFNAIK